MKDVQIRTDGKTYFRLEFDSMQDLQEAMGGMKSVRNDWKFLTDPSVPLPVSHPWGIPNRSRAPTPPARRSP